MPIPEDLDLDTWINDPPSDTSDSEDVDMNDIFVKTDKFSDNNYDRRSSYQPTTEELEKMREARKIEQQNNPHYLKNSKKKIAFSDKNEHNEEDYENIPVAELDIPVSLKILHTTGNLYLMDESGHKHRKKSSKKKRSKKSKKNTI